MGGHVTYSRHVPAGQHVLQRHLRLTASIPAHHHLLLLLIRQHLLLLLVYKLLLLLLSSRLLIPRHHGAHQRGTRHGLLLLNAHLLLGLQLAGRHHILLLLLLSAR